MKRPHILTSLLCLLTHGEVNATVIVADVQQFNGPSAQPLFPAGNLNVFKQLLKSAASVISKSDP